MGYDPGKLVGYDGSNDINRPDTECIVVQSTDTVPRSSCNAVGSMNSKLLGYASVLAL